MQVVNYGIGGHYLQHFDFLSANNTKPEADERIATFLFYLNDEEAGGATVFPRAGVRMSPRKGDAIFWYNLRRNTLGDQNTYHSACPVLLGTKWIANQWIGKHHQEFRRPCTLNKDE